MIERLLYMIPVAVLLWVNQNYQNKGDIYLDRSSYVVSDTSTYEYFWLKLINKSDSLLVIEDVHASCGCTLATLQRATAVRNKPGLIYISVSSEKIDTLQPIIISVLTNRNNRIPFQCQIVKRRRISSP